MFVSERPLRYLLVAFCLSLGLLCTMVALAAPPTGSITVSPYVWPTLTPAQYDRALGVIQEHIDADVETQKSGDTASLSEARLSVQPILHCKVVEPAEGSRQEQIIFVDNRPLLSALFRVDRETSPTRRLDRLVGIDQQITNLRAEVRSDFMPGDASAGRLVRSIAEGSDFSSYPAPPPPGWQKAMDQGIDKMLRAIKRFLDKLHVKTPTLPEDKIDPRVPLTILIVLLVLAGSSVIALLIRAILGRQNKVAKVQDAVTNLVLTAEESALVASRDFDKLILLAKQRADSGDYRSAFRLVYVATLVSLDVQGVVRLNRSITNWEYLRAVKQNGRTDIYSTLLPMTEGFDRIWYGLRPATMRDYESALRHYESINHPEEALV